ncbi:hypothetical protein MXB_4074 [Myxobolus squamalis]|nr:hypothetical protein MXB_4074 [Myxobolus squamalis]
MEKKNRNIELQYFIFSIWIILINLFSSLVDLKSFIASDKKDHFTVFCKSKARMTSSIKVYQVYYRRQICIFEIPQF